MMEWKDENALNAAAAASAADDPDHAGLALEQSSFNGSTRRIAKTVSSYFDSLNDV